MHASHLRILKQVKEDLNGRYELTISRLLKCEFAMDLGVRWAVEIL